MDQFQMNMTQQFGLSILFLNKITPKNNLQVGGTEEDVGGDGLTEDIIEDGGDS
jgi:hypothetical protein